MSNTNKTTKIFSNLIFDEKGGTWYCTICELLKNLNENFWVCSNCNFAMCENCSKSAKIWNYEVGDWWCRKCCKKYERMMGSGESIVPYFDPPDTNNNNANN